MTSKIKSLQGCEVLPPMPAIKEAVVEESVAEVRPDDRQAKDQGQGGRFAMLNTFVDSILSTIPKTDALVWLVLFRDTYGDTAKSAQAYIADRAGVCKRTVYTAIKRLKRAGFLEVVYQGGLNRGLSVYRLLPLVQAPSRGSSDVP